MDYQEAIEYMRKESNNQSINSEGQDAYIIVISAMQELQEYKQKLNDAYGECNDLLRTVADGLVRHEGIELGTPIKARLLTDDDADLWEGYKKLGTLEEIQEAMERQKDYKPIIYRLSTFGVPDEYLYCCPNCEYRIIKKDYRGFYSGPRTKYCPNCGQRLEWEE